MIRYSTENPPPVGAHVVILSARNGTTDTGRTGRVQQGGGIALDLTGRLVSLSDVYETAAIGAQWRHGTRMPMRFREGDEVILVNARRPDYNGYRGTLWRNDRGVWKVRVMSNTNGRPLVPAVNLTAWGEIARLSTVPPMDSEGAPVVVPQEQEPAPIRWTGDNLPPDGTRVRMVAGADAPEWVTAMINRPYPLVFRQGRGGDYRLGSNRIEELRPDGEDGMWVRVTPSNVTHWHMEPDTEDTNPEAVTSQEEVDYKARLDNLWRALEDQARQRNWCSEYDEFARKHGGPPRRRVYSVRLSIRAERLSADMVREALLSLGEPSDVRVQGV